VNVTLRSGDNPDIRITIDQYCNLTMLDQHLRALQAARRWLVKERALRREVVKQAAKTKAVTK